MLISILRKRLNATSISGRLYLLIALIVTSMAIEVLMILRFEQYHFMRVISLLIGVTILCLFIPLVKNIRNTIKAVELMHMRELAHAELAHTEAEQDIGPLSFDDITDKLENSILELKIAKQKLAREKKKRASSEKAKQIFLVNISHEIRTPMNGILGFAKILEECLIDEDQQESLQMIIKSADQLMTVLNDILDFSRLESGDINFVQQPFTLKDTVHAIYRLMLPASKVKELNFSYHIDPEIPEVLSGDHVRLGQILLNLTSNAFKFTESGEVHISLKAIESNEKEVTVEFRIHDTGIGIPQNKQQRVFDFFEQVTSDTSRRYAGTGLGLSIVKRLVELQGGAVFLDSTPGKGSDFYFRLPLKRVSERVAGEIRTASLIEPDVVAETGKGIRILVVEDNPINQLLVIRLLEKKGYETTVAENGKIALQEYQHANFDIILMDLQMPELDGYETTRIIRKMESRKKDIPIVAMTAHTIKGELEKCADIGMNDYISKPFDAAELYQKIDVLVESSELAKRG